LKLKYGESLSDFAFNVNLRRYIVDRYFAIRAAIAMAGPEDAVLICGKGHEAGQCTLPWVDRALLASLKLKYVESVSNLAFNSNLRCWLHTRLVRALGAKNMIHWFR